jgi:hypothetical protein
MQKSEIENLAAEFHAEVVATVQNHRGSKAVGAAGDFIADIEAHRARYAKKLDKIRVGADAATIALVNDIGQEIEALATKEIQHVRATGRVNEADNKR